MIDRRLRWSGDEDDETTVASCQEEPKFPQATGIENSPPWLRFGLFGSNEAGAQLLLEPVRIAPDVQRHRVMQ